MSHTVRSLRDQCKAKGLKGYSKATKAQLLELLTPTTSAQGQDTSQESQDIQTYKVLSLFTGMGGMDCGFAEEVVVQKQSVEDDFIQTSHDHTFVSLKRLPFSVVFQNDILKEAKKLADFNNWSHNYHLKDIRELLKENYPFPVAHVVIGGFPCQDFSHAGKRKGFDSSRGTLYQSFVEVVKRVRPYLFVAENVNGLLTMPGNPIQKIIGDFSAVGYEVKYQLLKCEEFGIPQTRWRVILMGIRLDWKPQSLLNNWNEVTENRRQVPIRLYFAHLQEPDETIDAAQKVYSKAAKLPKGQGQKEILLDSFAPTMRAEHHGNIEFRRTNGGKNNEPMLAERRLTVREAALIQTFPPNCILTEPGKAPTSMAYKPIGNAVPPLLGYLIARKVESILRLDSHIL
jgi:DNA (cytosine-5)-methyltransferase 1